MWPTSYLSTTVFFAAFFGLDDSERAVARLGSSSVYCTYILVIDAIQAHLLRREGA